MLSKETGLEEMLWMGIQVKWNENVLANYL
jgi:hypothetical protein